MRRVLAGILCALATTGLAGCLGAAAYEARMESYLKNLEFLQKLNQYTNAPVGGKFGQLGVSVRPPRPLDEAPSPIQAPTFDAVAYYSGAQADVPMQLYILARKKAAPNAKPKQGEPAQPPRGAFTSDVRTILDGLYGGSAGEGATTAVNEEGRTYNRRQFTTTNGNTVKVDQYEKGSYEVALIWDYAASAATSPAVEPGIRYTLGSLTVGGGGVQPGGGGVGF